MWKWRNRRGGGATHLFAGLNRGGQHYCPIRHASDKSKRRRTEHYAELQNICSVCLCYFSSPCGLLIRGSLPKPQQMTWGKKKNTVAVLLTVDQRGCLFVSWQQHRRMWNWTFPPQKLPSHSKFTAMAQPAEKGTFDNWCCWKALKQADRWPRKSLQASLARRLNHRVSTAFLGELMWRNGKYDSTLNERHFSWYSLDFKSSIVMHLCCLYVH